MQQSHTMPQVYELRQVYEPRPFTESTEMLIQRSKRRESGGLDPVGNSYSTSSLGAKPTGATLTETFSGSGRERHEECGDLEYDDSQTEGYTHYDNETQGYSHYDDERDDYTNGIFHMCYNNY